jgi:hypothetical protein
MPPLRRLLVAVLLLIGLMTLFIFIRNTLAILTLDRPNPHNQQQGRHIIPRSQDDAVAAVEEEEERSTPRPTSQLNTSSSTFPDWKSTYTSPACLAHRSRPVGRAVDGNVGRGQRAMCTDLEDTEELRKEILGSVDVSVSHKTIYVPVMKAGTQMFQEVLKRRFAATRVTDRDLARVLRKNKLELSDMFVFTFVRSPLSMFRSGYGEMSLYAAHDKIMKQGFTLIQQTEANEPARAIECLQNVGSGLFSGLVPAHLFTQVWKTQRCMGRVRQPLGMDFVGRLENVEKDWKFVEERLGVAHVPLPVIHASDLAKERVMAKQMIKFDAVSAARRFSNLTALVCQYYKADFDCFGYDDAVCK